jgi:hypothetical protein
MSDHISGASYIASAETLFRYPGAGDARPPGGAKVLLLTLGGVCVIGCWSEQSVGWAPLPKRDKEKERRLPPLISTTLGVLAHTDACDDSKA